MLQLPREAKCQLYNLERTSHEAHQNRLSSQAQTHEALETSICHMANSSNQGDTTHLSQLPRIQIKGHLSNSNDKVLHM